MKSAPNFLLQKSHSFNKIIGIENIHAPVKFVGLLQERHRTATRDYKGIKNITIEVGEGVYKESI